MMKLKMILKIVLGLLLFHSTVPSFCQQDSIGIVKGKVIMFGSGFPYSDVSVFITLDSGRTVSSSSNSTGEFELKVPTGVHIIQAKTPFSSVSKTIEVNNGETKEIEITLSQNGHTPIWEYSEPYELLSGYWQFFSYTKDNETFDEPNKLFKPAVSFYMHKKESPGMLNWNDGCNRCGSLFFRHLGDGVLEIQNGNPYCTMVGCDYMVEFKAFIKKIKGNKINSAITNNGQTLELSLENEKLVFRKIHDNTLTYNNEINTELFGKWKPIEGKLEGKRITTFAEEAEIQFSNNNGPKRAAIQYKDAINCIDGLSMTYKYMDEDFITFWYHRFSKKQKMCNKDFQIAEIFSQLSRYGCNIKFDDSRDTVVLEFGENMLFMKRI